MTGIVVTDTPTITVTATEPPRAVIHATSGPQGTPGESIVVFGHSHVLTVTAGASRYRFPFPATLVGISAAVGTAPTGAPILIDVNRGGATVFGFPSDRLSIAAGEHDAAETTEILHSAIAAGDYLTCDIDQVGSSDPGADLTVFIRYQRND
jgi:hypothetical protein